MKRGTVDTQRIGKNLLGAKSTGAASDVTLGPSTRRVTATGSSAGVPKGATPARGSQNRAAGETLKAANAFAALEIDEPSAAPVEADLEGGDMELAEDLSGLDELQRLAELIRGLPDSVTRRNEGTIKEYLNLKDTGEVLECVKEAQTNHGDAAVGHFCLMCIRMSLESKDVSLGLVLCHHHPARS